MNDCPERSPKPLLLRSIDEFRQWRASLHGDLGLVPTMGALHPGHMALIERALAENQNVAVSIFVNPRQFAKNEFETYPRTMDDDVRKLREAGVSAVFTPVVSEVYPADSTTEIDVGRPGVILEGASRPGHFSGVALVVNKLFNICQPQRAYFGWKDAQQVLVIQRMVRDLNMPVDIVPIETVRDPDGLAISSRNVFLSAGERASAATIPRSLFAARDAFLAGEREASRLRDIVRRFIEPDALLRIDYISLADAETLDELAVVDRPAILSLAVYCGSTRLIDNVRL